MQEIIVKKKRKARILSEDHKRNIGIGTAGKGRKPIPSGERFGRLLTTGNTKKYPNGYSVECVCDCGTTVWRKEYYLRHHGTKSCGCLQKEITSKRSLLSPGESCRNTLFSNYRNRALIRNISFDLTIEQFNFITKSECHYCGGKPSQKINTKYGGGAYIYNGIDRMNNNDGYTPENSVPCCWTCNNMKKNMGYDEFMGHVSKICVKAYSKRV